MIMIVYFNYSVIRRLVSLLSEQAKLVAQKEAALKQAQNASDEASRQMAQAKVMHCCVNNHIIRYCYRNHLELLQYLIKENKLIKNTS